MSFSVRELRDENPLPDDIAIRLQDVSKRFLLYKRPLDRLLQIFWRERRRFFEEVKVLENITLDVARGETIGVVGRNGAGKSTLLQIIAGTLQPSDGLVKSRGRVAPLIELGTGFNPELTGLENILFYGMLLGMDDQEIDHKFDSIVRFADIGSYIERPVKTYSSGMYARLAFAVAMHIDPEILIVDEIFAVGDLPFQQKCMDKFYEIKDKGCTILIVAHDEYLVRSLCDKAIYLRNGQLAHFGPSKDVIANYMFDLQSVASAAADIPSPEFDFKATNGTVPKAVDEKNSCDDGSSKSETDNKSTLGHQTDSQKHFRITKVELLSSDGQAVDCIECGMALDLRMSYETISRDPPEKISFVFNLYRHDGLYICGTTTLMDGQQAYRCGRHGQVTVSFPRLSLLAGRYIWRVAINDSGGMLVLAEAKGVCPFKVDDDSRSVGIFHLDHSWSISVDNKVHNSYSNRRTEKSPTLSRPTKFEAQLD